MHRGFSLIELLIVIVVIGILAVGAYPLVGGEREADAAARQAELIGFLRLQQMTAMQNTGSATQYGVSVTAAAVTPKPDNGSHTVVATDSGGFSVSQASVNLGELDLFFDSLGCPYLGSGGSAPSNLCAATSGYEIAVGGSFARQVCIEPQGYIHPDSCQ